MNNFLSESSLTSKSEQEYVEAIKGNQVMKKLFLKKESANFSDVSMEINSEMKSMNSNETPVHQMPTNQKKAKRILSSDHFKFGSSKNLVSGAK